MAQAISPAQDSAALLAKATVRAADQMGLRQGELAKVLGLSAATTSRLRSGAWQLPTGSKAWELATIFVRVYRSLAAITGGDGEAMRAWLHSGNDALGSEPATMLLAAEGLISVLRYLDAARGHV
jgi:transcriptional regulator with XRE-family HTH domain